MIAVILCSIAILQLADAKQPPIIIVPGFGGSYIEALKGLVDMKTLWYAPKKMAQSKELYRDMFTQQYDEAKKKIVNKIPDLYLAPKFGTPEGVQYISPDNKVKYLYTLVEHLKANSFKHNPKQIYGAPFDFRCYPKVEPNFDKLMSGTIKHILEMKENKGEKITILAFDLGAVFMLNFLNQMTETWKKDYIGSFIVVGAPLGGTVKSMELLTKGLKYSTLTMDPDMFHFSSVLGMLPMEGVWKKDEVLYKDGDVKVTAADYTALFAKVKLDKGTEMLSYVNENRKLMLEPPKGIDNLHCIYGSGVDTLESFGPAKTDVKYGKGDGYVNERSLSLCKKWPNVTVKEFKKVDHIKLFEDSNFISYVDNLINSSTGKYANHQLLLISSIAIAICKWSMS